MNEFDFSKICDEGVKTGQKRLDEADSFNSTISSFCESYSNSLSAFSGERVKVSKSGVDTLEALIRTVKTRRAKLRPEDSGICDGPVRHDIKASVMGKSGQKKKTAFVFRYTGDSLTGLPCAIEYNGKSILCNSSQELFDALKGIPAERSSHVIKQLGLVKKSV